MSYHGDIRLGDTIDVKFTSRRFSTGAPFTLAGSPAVAAYVGNGTTEITSGITLSVDFDSRTGLNNVRVVASGGNGFATATNVQLVLTAGTVDSVSVVGEVVGSFSIENRSALMPTTSGQTLDVSAGGEAGVDWANIGSPTTTVNLSGTSTKALEPTTAGRTLDVSSGGEAGIDWANVGTPGSTVNLSATTVNLVNTATTLTNAPSNSAGVTTLLARIPSAGLICATGTVQDGSPFSGSFRTTLTEASNHWNRGLLAFTSGTLTGQVRPIDTYVQTNGVVNLGTAFTSAPANGDAFVILPWHHYTDTATSNAVSAAEAASAAADTAANRIGTPTNLGSGASVSANLVDIEAQTDDIGAAGAGLTGLADLVLGRSVSTVQASAAEHSLCSLILAGLESSVSGTTWTIKRTDGTTTHLTKTVTVNSAADPITGVT